MNGLEMLRDENSGDASHGTSRDACAPATHADRR
jgi:hypothetical protein